MSPALLSKRDGRGTVSDFVLGSYVLASKPKTKPDPTLLRTEEEWVAADEAAAAEADDQAVITVPTVLLPEIRRLLATHKTA